MKPEDKKQLLELLSESNSCKVSFNVPVIDNYSSAYEVLIHECNADLTNKLIEMGFSLHMRPKGLSVDKYA